MNDQQAEDFLSHYGVKGMKWGVTRSDAQLARASRMKRVSEGKGSVGDNVKTAAGMTGYQLARGGGSFKKAAGKKAAAIEGKVTKKQEKATAKANEKAATKERVGTAREAARAKRKVTKGTHIAVDIFATGGLLTGNDIARSAGYSKGKSAAIALFGGPIGATAAAELRYRR